MMNITELINIAVVEDEHQLNDHLNRLSRNLQTTLASIGIRGFQGETGLQAEQVVLLL